MLRLIPVAAPAVFISAAVQAASVSIDAGGAGSFTLDSAPISDVFGSDDPHFTSHALNAVHGAMHEDGISTEGVVTILLTDTDHGLSLMALVDDNTAGGYGLPDSLLGIQTTVTGESSSFINDVFDLFHHEDGAEGSQTVTGLFIWDSDHRGDDIAWAGLDDGDAGEFHFLDIAGPGLDGGQAFQFVSFTGDKWEVIGTADFECHYSTFAFAVVPLPAAVLMGAVGLAGLVVGRKRLRR